MGGFMDGETFLPLFVAGRLGKKDILDASSWLLPQMQLLMPYNFWPSEQRACVREKWYTGRFCVDSKVVENKKDGSFDSMSNVS